MALEDYEQKLKELKPEIDEYMKKHNQLMKQVGNITILPVFENARKEVNDDYNRIMNLLQEAFKK